MSAFSRHQREIGGVVSAPPRRRWAGSSRPRPIIGVESRRLAHHVRSARAGDRWGRIDPTKTDVSGPLSQTLGTRWVRFETPRAIIGVESRRLDHHARSAPSGDRWGRVDSTKTGVSGPLSQAFGTRWGAGRDDPPHHRGRVETTRLSCASGPAGRSVGSSRPHRQDRRRQASESGLWDAASGPGGRSVGSSRPHQNRRQRASESGLWYAVGQVETTRPIIVPHHHRQDAPSIMCMSFAFSRTVLRGQGTTPNVGY